MTYLGAQLRPKQKRLRSVDAAPATGNTSVIVKALVNRTKKREKEDRHRRAEHSVSFPVPVEIPVGLPGRGLLLSPASVEGPVLAHSGPAT